MNKTSIIVLVVVVIVIGVVALVLSQSSAPTYTDQAGDTVAPLAPENNSPAAMASEAGNVDLGNLDQEFQAIDQDLNSL